MRIIGYARVSTGRQTEGSSLEAQAAKIRDYARAHGHEVVDVLVDAGLSGKAMGTRPALLKALAILKAGMADGIVVASLSRLSRSMADLSALIRDHFQPRKKRKAAAALISVGEAFDTGTPAGRAMCQLLGVFAELEREMTSARCRDAAEHNRSMGRAVGPPPYGWRALGQPGDKQRRLVPCPAELEYVAIAKIMRTSGATLQVICDELHRLGYVSRVGKPFAPNQVARMLQAPDPAMEEIAA